MLPPDTLFFHPFLLYPVSDLHGSLMAFPAFPASLVLSFTDLSPSKSLTLLVLLLSASWRTWNNTVSATPISFSSLFPLPLCFPYWKSCYCLTWHWNSFSSPAHFLPSTCPFFSIILQEERARASLKVELLETKASGQLVPFLLWVQGILNRFILVLIRKLLRMGSALIFTGEEIDIQVGAICPI